MIFYLVKKIGYFLILCTLIQYKQTDTDLDYFYYYLENTLVYPNLKYFYFKHIYNSYNLYLINLHNLQSNYTYIMIFLMKNTHYFRKYILSKFGGFS